MAIKTTEHWRDRDLLSRRFVPGGQGRVAYVKYLVDRLINDKRARTIVEHAEQQHIEPPNEQVIEKPWWARPVGHSLKKTCSNE